VPREGKEATSPEARRRRAGGSDDAGVTAVALWVRFDVAVRASVRSLA
jgi:hypothetical protein